MGSRKKFKILLSLGFLHVLKIFQNLVMVRVFTLPIKIFEISFLLLGFPRALRKISKKFYGPCKNFEGSAVHKILKIIESSLK